MIQSTGYMLDWIAQIENKQGALCMKSSPNMFLAHPMNVSSSQFASFKPSKNSPYSYQYKTTNADQCVRYPMPSFLAHILPTRDAA